MPTNPDMERRLRTARLLGWAVGTVIGRVFETAAWLIFWFAYPVRRLVFTPGSPGNKEMVLL
jgi:hypothetical protein